MKIPLLLVILLILGFTGFTQSYSDSIYSHREKYKQEFLTDDHSPLKEEDTSFLRFFKPDKKYRFIAVFEKASDTMPFEMQTHSGKIKMYRKYGTVCFTLNKKSVSLKCIKA